MGSLLVGQDVSAGLQLIAALAAEGGSLHGIREEYFNAEERPAWDLLSRYHLEHGGMPTAAVFAEAGIRLCSH